MAKGAVTPDFFATENLVGTFFNTVAFALLGVAFGSIAGFFLTLVFHHRAVKVFCAFIRAIHELFWALIFLQIFGLTPVTALLAIAIPYSGVFAKVYSEILEEADTAPLRTLHPETSRLSALLYARLPDSMPHILSYTLYRFECGLRSSAVLGFVGLPTIGYHLESAFAQGNYSEVSGLLILFYLVIASMRWWVRPKLLPVYLFVSMFAMRGGAEINWENGYRFFASDIVPHPVRVAENFDLTTMMGLLEWTRKLIMTQAYPGLLETIPLTMIALVCTGVFALATFPLISPLFFGARLRLAGHIFLVIIRSTPEYILAYIFLQLWGPSAIPAILALSLHNGAIIGHLIGRRTEKHELRQDSSTGLNLYAFETLPAVYPNFMAFLFYRWEIIMRETAILGILGIHTLGFYIDSSFSDMRFDRAFFLILITALLNIGIDWFSGFLRRRLRLRTTPDDGKS